MKIERYTAIEEIPEYNDICAAVTADMAPPTAYAAKVVAVRRDGSHHLRRFIRECEKRRVK